MLTIRLFFEFIELCFATWLTRKSCKPFDKKFRLWSCNSNWIREVIILKELNSGDHFYMEIFNYCNNSNVISNMTNFIIWTSIQRDLADMHFRTASSHLIGYFVPILTWLSAASYARDFQTILDFTTLSPKAFNAAFLSTNIVTFPYYFIWEKQPPLWQRFHCFMAKIFIAWSWIFYYLPFYLIIQ